MAAVNFLSSEVRIMRHVAMQPTETTSDVTCDACCQSTSIEGYGQQFGVLQACWGYGSKHDGERYEVHLCEPCFFRTLAMLRRERMVNTMFDDDLDTNQDEFGLVRKDDFWAEG
ncbi:TPA: hypothetical protein L5633_006235 [Pseudomonas aeruginosa]|jgi:hypothetical protein|nr:MULTISPECIES: hypothetical protein [Pseudomonas]NKQ11263.1 hypothetical protein [Pseudomonas sp. SST3]KSJ48838.2 hypothetical protein APA00_32385 [Pseudomonas aeruginosa]MCG3646722.1 hypothetical protein [Pseudomonas putida]MCO2603647.1 hypothetical protein [Pseudomonas aeruginosa]MCS8841870.1 hypothetical protein [Pseudomonas aeruginosa]|tara:strand:+ start:1070 stop:1411 length:342 start_codon:yes stop_codon:yes gene_type:complete